MFAIAGKQISIIGIDVHKITPSFVVMLSLTSFTWEFNSTVRVYNELTIDQLSVGLIAQLVRALHRYRRGHGFDSRSGLIFFLTA